MEEGREMRERERESEEIDKKEKHKVRNIVPCLVCLSLLFTC